MTFARLFSILAVLVAAHALAGCGRNAAPVAPEVATPQLAARDGSWIDAAAARGALLYISDQATETVWIYSYPQLKLTGKLAGVRQPAGLCVDPRTRNVWVVSAVSSKVVEFAHGATSRTRTLEAAPNLEACAADASGNLAVAEYNDYDDPGGLLVFESGRGKPMRYDNREMFYYSFAAYDSAGDVFVDGEPYAKLEELPAGRMKLKNVTPNGLNFSPGGVQYDGTDIAVGSRRNGLIARISGRSITGTTKLKGTCLVRQFFIDAASGVVIAPSACKSKGEVLIYNYPAGGNPIKRITGIRDPFGAVVSK